MVNQQLLNFTKFTEGYQYQCTDGLVGTGLMPYKAHSLKYQHFMGEDQDLAARKLNIILYRVPEPRSQGHSQGSKGWGGG